MPVIFLTSGAGSNQIWTVPTDWTDNNTIDCIGGGGTGGSGTQGVSGGGGGGGGSHARSINITGLLSGGSVTYQCGSAAGDTWFNSAAFPTAGQSCGSKGGVSGSGSAHGAGGLASGCYFTGSGSFAFNGGDGVDGTLGSSNVAGGPAGGAAGPRGIGANGSGSQGGNGDASFGGAGGSSNSIGEAGGELSWGLTTAGSGGGGGGTTAGVNPGRAGGLYGGGGGGGGANAGSGTGGGAGKQGIIIITYNLPVTVFEIGMGQTYKKIEMVNY